MRLRFLAPCLCMAVSLLTGGAGAAEPAAVRLVAQPALGADLAAFPRIAAADGAAARRINQALTDADRRAQAAGQACRAETVKSKGDPSGGGWQRSVTVAMRGPGYLSLVAADSWYCGGPYPSETSFALAYDLRTGAPLNWERLLPKKLAGTATLDTAGDGTPLGVVNSPALMALYVTLMKPDPDCAQALQDYHPQFMLWPDAARNGVAMEPSGLPHVVAACGPDVVIPLATARTLGVEPALLDAIAAGHEAGLYDPVK